MKVDKETGKIDIKTLTREEAKSHIDCLRIERIRHTIARNKAIRDRALDGQWSRHRGIFWATAVHNHQADIDEIDALIDEVKEMYGV